MIFYVFGDSININGKNMSSSVYCARFCDYFVTILKFLAMGIKNGLRYQSLKTVKVLIGHNDYFQSSSDKTQGKTLGLLLTQNKKIVATMNLKHATKMKMKHFLKQIIVYWHQRSIITLMIIF